MKLSCLGFALFVGALINDSAFLESKQHVEEIVRNHLFKASPLALALKWTRFVNLSQSQTRGGDSRWAWGSTWRQGGCQRKGGTQAECGPAENTNIWCVERSQDYGSYKQDLQKLQIIPRHQHETINSHFPSSSESNLIHLDLTHSDFPIIPYHHQTLSLS